MTNSTPNSKALLSAIIGLVAAALIVGTISFGPALGQSLQGQDLASSAQAREGFVVAEASSKASTKALTTPPANATTNVAVVPAIAPQPEDNFAVAAAGGGYEDDTDENEDDESEDD